MMDEDGVREMLRKEAGQRGVLRWCEARGISNSYVYNFLSGRRGPGPLILNALGLETRYSIRKEKACVEPEPGI